MFETRVTIKKRDAYKQIVYGEVYVPMVPDSQGDYMTREEIERVAHAFLRKGTVESIDTEHSLKINGSGFVESFVVRKGDPDFIEGSWVVGIHIPDRQTWQDVLDGKINGFSMYGTGERVEKVVEIEIPDDGRLYGTTQPSQDELTTHSHEYYVEFDSNGKFLGGQTDEIEGHSHQIVKGTATEASGGDRHNHRFNMIDLLYKKCGPTDKMKKYKTKKDDMTQGDIEPTTGQLQKHCEPCTTPKDCMREGRCQLSYEKTEPEIVKAVLPDGTMLVGNARWVAEQIAIR